MARTPKKIQTRQRRKKSIRQKVTGTSSRPRMSVFRSNKHIYVQVIDDTDGRTLASASTLNSALRADVAGSKKVDIAKRVGQLAAERCLEAKVEQVVFDRNGYVYTGRVAALAAGAREAGLKF